MVAVASLISPSSFFRNSLRCWLVFVRDACFPPFDLLDFVFSFQFFLILSVRQESVSLGFTCITFPLLLLISSFHFHHVGSSRVLSSILLFPFVYSFCCSPSPRVRLFPLLTPPLLFLRPTTGARHPEPEGGRWRTTQEEGTQPVKRPFVGSRPRGFSGSRLAFHHDHDHLGYR